MLKSMKIWEYDCKNMKIWKFMLKHDKNENMMTQVVLPPSHPLLVTTAGRPLDTQTLTEVDFSSSSPSSLSPLS